MKNLILAVFVLLFVLLVFPIADCSPNPPEPTHTKIAEEIREQYDLIEVTLTERIQYEQCPVIRGRYSNGWAIAVTTKENKTITGRICRPDSSDPWLILLDGSTVLR